MEFLYGFPDTRKVDNIAFAHSDRIVMDHGHLARTTADGVPQSGKFYDILADDTQLRLVPVKGGFAKGRYLGEGLVEAGLVFFKGKAEKGL